MNNSFVTKKLSAALVASVCLLSAIPASATVVNSLTASASVTAGSNPTLTDGPNTSASSTSAIKEDSTAIAPESLASASAFGHVAGAYGAFASGTGDFDSTGHFTREWVITNDAAVAQNYTFNFLIFAGNLVADDKGLTGSGFADYLLNIKQNNSTVLFNSSAKYTNEGVLTSSGTALNGASANGISYSWSSTNLSLGLGVLLPGASTTVTYDLISHAFGNYDSGACKSFNVLRLAIVAPGPGLPDPTCTGNSSARIGDPNGFTSTPVPGINIIASSVDVPEPASMLLLGLGLLVLKSRRKLLS